MLEVREIKFPLKKKKKKTFNHQKEKAHSEKSISVKVRNVLLSINVLQSNFPKVL